MASASPKAFTAVVDPNDVGNAFVLQYYKILYNKPEFLVHFYQNFSRIGRPGQDKKMVVISPSPAMNENLPGLACGDFEAAEISTVDSQQSYNGGVFVVVTGYFRFHEKNIKRKFIQSFFLAPQENGYFILNDIFRFEDELKTKDGDTVTSKASETPIPPLLGPTKGDNASEQPASTWVDPGDEEASKPLDPAVEATDPVTEIINEVAELEITSAKGLQMIKKKLSELEIGSQDVPRIAHATVASGKTLKVKKKKTEVLAATTPPQKQVVSEEGSGVYVTNLPPNATQALLENEFKQFGTIRSGGIQVKHQTGFAFGFVEFEEAVAARRAIEASPVMMGGRKAIVKEKRCTSTGKEQGALL